LCVELAEDLGDEVVRHRPWRRRTLKLHQDRRGLGLADPDRQVAVAVLRLQQDDRLLANKVETDPVDVHLLHPDRSRA
jgi:hypothetical protein